MALLPWPLLSILCCRVPVSRGLAGEGLCVATGVKLQACLGGLSAPLAALAVLEEPDRIWQQEESQVTFLCPPGRTVQVLMGTPGAGS